MFGFSLPANGFPIAIVAAIVGSVTTFLTGYVWRWWGRCKRKDRIRRALLTEMKYTTRLVNSNERGPENIGDIPVNSFFPTDTYETLVPDLQLLNSSEVEAVVDYYAGVKDVTEAIEQAKLVLGHENTDKAEAAQRTAIVYSYIRGTVNKRETAQTVLRQHLLGDRFPWSIFFEGSANSRNEVSDSSSASDNGEDDGTANDVEKEDEPS